MNFLKKLLTKLKKKDKKENETWYNDQMNTYDPKVGTPNGEAYISPDSVSISIANHLSN